MGALPFTWLIMKGVRVCHLKICHLDIGLFCSEGKWETADAALRFQPGAGLKLPLVSRHPSPLSHTRKRANLLTGERKMAQRGRHKQTLGKEPLSSNCLPCKSTFPQYHPEKPPPLFLCLSPLQNLLPFVKMVWKNLSLLFCEAWVHSK